MSDKKLQQTLSICQTNGYDKEVQILSDEVARRNLFVNSGKTPKRVAKDIYNAIQKLEDSFVEEHKLPSGLDEDDANDMICDYKCDFEDVVAKYVGFTDADAMYDFFNDYNPDLIYNMFDNFSDNYAFDF